MCAVVEPCPEIVPSVPLQNLSRSLADLDEMRIATFPRIALETGQGQSVQSVSEWACSRPAHPRLFVPSAEGNPCPCRSCTAHNPDDDHLRAAHPPAHDLPVPCDGAASVMEQLDTHVQYLALNHHRPQLDVPCVHVETVQDHISGGAVASQPAPAEMNRSSTSKQSSEQPAGQPVAQPSPHPALTTSRASLLTSGTCFEPNSAPQPNPAYPSPCSNPISLEKARVPMHAA